MFSPCFCDRYKSLLYFLHLSVTGISGKITFDSIGAKEPDFSLYDINPSTGEFHVSTYLFVCFSATFNNISVISWRSVLLVEETGGPGENH